MYIDDNTQGSSKEGLSDNFAPNLSGKENEEKKLK